MGAGHTAMATPRDTRSIYLTYTKNSTRYPSQGFTDHHGGEVNGSRRRLKGSCSRAAQQLQGGREEGGGAA